MAPLEPPKSATEAANAITELNDTAWVLAALIDVFSREARPSCNRDDLAAQVLASAGLFVEDADGISPAPGLADLIRETGVAPVDGARSVLGQVAVVARGESLNEGWAEQADETLLAQGAASGRFVSAFLPRLFAQVPELHDRLKTPGARFLDVGVGVGAMACAIANAIPSLSIVGIDPFRRALRLAAQRVAELGLEDRVTLRRCGVEEVDDEEAFDLAWLPAPFIPPPLFATGVERLFRALRSGGWILVGMGRLEGKSLSTAVTRWQTALIGGTPLTQDEAIAHLTRVGFVDGRKLESSPGAPVAVIARRTA
ncbi:MAG: SAM-dependent methyltransferase [Acidimicrobiales bacterium]